MKGVNSKFVTIRNSKMHYLEQGKGKTLLFLHGMPTSSYVWRNIIPEMHTHAHCIAPDLIGMGKSDKPDIAYRVFDHIQYITDFINTLQLRDITLVLHGWGSVIGFAYAMQHPENIKAIAFYEAYVGSMNEWKKFSLPVQEMIAFVRKPESEKFIMHDEKAIDKILYTAGFKKLDEEDLQIYRAPFNKPEDRKPIWQYVQDTPFGKGKEDVVELIHQYTHYLIQSNIPKLLLYSIPGFVTTMENIVWCRNNLTNLSIVDMGEELHYMQEYNPHAFSAALLKWYTSIFREEKISL
jgi:haloalkane dehalogenase